MGKLLSDAEMLGRRFGLLVVQARAPKVRGRTAWSVLCDCGAVSVTTGNSLRTGNCQSCGCIKRASAPGRTHGLAGTRAHAIWKAAKQRCFDPNASNYRHYGGRGITMDPRWANDCQAFWDHMGECPPNHSLDRIDPNGNYEPGNCRWATQADQVRNTRRNVLVEHEGQTVCLKDYAAARGVSYNGLRWRIREIGEDPVTAATKLIERRTSAAGRACPRTETNGPARPIG